MAEKEDLIGVFIGLEHSAYEYIANIIAPYKTEFHLELGSFILVDDAPSRLVARVIDFVPQGELVSFMGQKWLSDVALNSDAIGSDIKKRKISYSVKIKLLGSLDANNKFDAGLKNIPHITSKVVKPTTKEVEKIIHQALDEQQKKGVEIGKYFLNDEIPVKFNLAEVIAKRTFIFARAGYGKSNLMKLLAANWQEENGSLVIFDPDGEYAFTDKKNRPGIMDKKEAILITNQQEKKDVKNIYRNMKLNLKELSPQFVIPILVQEEKQNTIFFSKLMGLSRTEWGQLVDLLKRDGWRASLEEIRNIVVGQPGQENGGNDSQVKDMVPIQNNLVHPIQTLHDSNSHLLQIVENAMKKGKIIIFDISILDSKTALRLSSIIVKHIFNKNQSNFISGSRENLIRATFAMDEAQTVLARDSSVAAFVELAKEGRKYELGGIFITQQPGTIPFEILSQADNFFVFHLLSRGDLESLQKANAHYSPDIITQILNEPKKGKCYMWTSTQPFVLSVQIANFEDKESINKSKEIQNNSNILDPVLKEITEELSSPVFKSIIQKYKEAESEHAGEDVKVKTKKLFEKLTDEEKKYLEERDALQPHVGGQQGYFAVKIPYYTNNLSVMSETLGNCQN